jgi:hypothetical protein
MTSQDHHSANQCTQTHRKRPGRGRAVTMVVVGLAALVGTVGANGGTGGVGGPTVPAPAPGTASFIDWDLDAIGGAGACPSAIGAITMRPIDAPAPIDPVYYVTQCSVSSDTVTVSPRLVELRTEMHPQPAAWRAWSLGDSPLPTATDPLLLEGASLTGGMRLSNTNRVFVRTNSEMLRLDFTASPVKLTRWQDVVTSTATTTSDVAAQSDIALVNRSGGYTDVWSTHDSLILNPGSTGGVVGLNGLPPIIPVLPVFAPTPGVVERLTIANNSTIPTVTRYATDGGAGLYYLSGIVSFQGKIYYSEGSPITTMDPITHVRRGNSIAALDPNTGDVHRFSLTDVDPTVTGPRQISLDTSTNTLWVVTQSGHIVSFKPNSNCGNGLPNTAQMAAYRIPGVTTDPHGVSPAGGTVGFTQTGSVNPLDGNKVGTLVPNKTAVPVTATQETVRKETFCLKGTTQTVIPDTGSVQGMESPNLPAVHTDLDGKFTQAMITPGGDFPQGILRDPFSCRKAFYFAVAFSPTIHRLSRVEFDADPDPLPVPDLTAPDSTRPGLVTGGGTMGTDPTAVDLEDVHDLDSWAPGGGQASFDFVTYRNWTGAPPSGRISYYNKLTGDDIKSTAITSFSINGTQASFGGTCINNKAPILPCTFQVTVGDNGYPGKAHDTFSISGIGFLANQGTLTGGNIYTARRDWD